MKVSEWLDQHPYQVMPVMPETTIEQMVDMLLAYRPFSTDLYVVDEKGLLLGHISSKSVLNHYLVEHQPVQSRRELMNRITKSTAMEMMERQFPKAELDESMDAVLPRQVHHEITEMAVVDDNGELCGVINLYTLARSLRSLDRVNSEDNQDCM